MRFPRVCVVLYGLSALARVAHAECEAAAAAPRPHLVELYTSEGCSSCPPADAWLRRAPRQASVAALEFHVDYWDDLGWRDRFADSRYTARQQRQSALEGGSGIYTPQVVVDGRSWPGWYRSAAPQAPATGSATMRLTTSLGHSLQVHVQTSIEPASTAADYRNFIAVTQDGLSTQVRAGENRGATLLHDHVVRAFAGPLTLTADADLRLPEDLDPARSTIVAFVQRQSDGAVAQVLSCGMDAR